MGRIEPLIVHHIELLLDLLQSRRTRLPCIEGMAQQEDPSRGVGGPPRANR